MIIVGYATSDLDLEYGAVMTSAQFSDVTDPDGKISIKQLKPVAAEDWVDLAGSVEIQILDDAGVTLDEYDFMWDGEQWMDIEGKTVEDVKFIPGQGMWVFNYTGEKVGFQSAGQVIDKDLSFELDLEYGAVGVGNCYPVAIDLADIYPEAEEDWVDLAGSIEIQILDDAGVTIDAFDFMWDGEQWLDVNGNPAKGSFDAGQGLWVFNYTGEKVNLIIPAPEFK